MSADKFTIRIEKLENGFEVEVPDFEEIKKKEAEAKKAKRDYPVYTGDCTKKYAAKSMKEVLALVKSSLANAPDVAFDEAFDEATKS